MLSVVAYCLTNTNVGVAQCFRRALASRFVTPHRADRVTAAHAVVFARALALTPVTNRAVRTIAVGRAVGRIVAALRVRVAQQSVRANARKRPSDVVAVCRPVTRAPLALVHVLALAVSQFVTLVTSAYALMFERFTVPVSAVDRVARA